MTDQDRLTYLAKARLGRETANEAPAQAEMEMVRFATEDLPIDFNVDWSRDTVWATQKQMSDLFGVGVAGISKHISAIFDQGELSPAATVSNLERVQIEGGRPVTRRIEHYNLDVILTIGYRVNGTKAAAFRVWANGILKRYISQGYALDERRLHNDPTALTALAARVRALRSEERNIYSAVRDCFKEAASDYHPSSPAARTFYARVQDRFLYAATGKTAAEIVLERADGNKPNMGVTTFQGRQPTKAECCTGKNYLFSEELYVLHIMCEQFLLFAESKAMRGQIMTMDQLTRKVDQLFAANDYPLFPGYQNYMVEKAKEHAELEWHLMMERISTGQHLSAA